MASVIRKIIQSPLTPKAIGPYSQAVLVDRTLYVSGQIGLDANSGSLVDGGIEAETRKALENLGHVLRAAGTDFTSVVKTTVLLANINDSPTVNEIYKEFFKDNYPARAAFQVAQLPKGSQVEIEAVAIVGPMIDC